MLEQCPVKDKHDSNGDVEKKESVTGENGTTVVPIEPVEAMASIPVSCNTSDTKVHNYMLISRVYNIL